MTNLVTTFESNGYDVTIWEDKGKFTMEIILGDQEENTITIGMDKMDVLQMVEGFAKVSTDLAKEMITEIVENM